MVGSVLSQSKPSELYILSCVKGLGLPPRPFTQLRVWSSEGVIQYIIKPNCVRMASTIWTAQCVIINTRRWPGGPGESIVFAGTWRIDDFKF